MREPQPTAIVFDLDGTLVDSMGPFLGVYVQAIRDLGGPDVTPDDVVAAFHVGATADLLSHFLGRRATDPELDRFYALAAAAAPRVRSFNGVPEMLSVLAARNVPLGVFTGATRRATELLLTSCDLARHFDSVVAGDEVTRPKPCDEGLLMACDRLRVPPSNVAYVGDSQLDIDCARNAGCVAVIASWGGGSDGVTGGDVVAGTPADVTQLVTPDGRA